MSAWEASYSLVCVAGVRKGRGRKFGRETVRLSRVSRGWNPLPVPFQTPATQATGGREKVLGQTCVRRKSGCEIRNAQFLITEFNTFLKLTNLGIIFLRLTLFTLFTVAGEQRCDYRKYVCCLQAIFTANG